MALNECLIGVSALQNGILTSQSHCYSLAIRLVVQHTYITGHSPLQNGAVLILRKYGSSSLCAMELRRIDKSLNSTSAQ